MNARFVSALLVLMAVAKATPIPTVGSGTLLANFRVADSSVARDILGNVVSWTAENNPAFVLTAAGGTPGNIVYSATGMNGAPELVVNDAPGSSNQYLTGPLGGPLTATTIFWLGYYLPGRGGSPSDSLGQYVYSLGADGADGSQMDHQIDGGLFQLYGGGGTQSGANISAFNGVRTVWTTFYGQGTGNGHSAFAGATNLGVSSPNGGNYNVSGNLVLFGFQGATPGVSAGFNFVGNIGELIIYNGILSAGDVTAVQNYLLLRAAGDLGDANPPSAVPEPGTWATTVCALGALLFRRRRR